MTRYQKESNLKWLAIESNHGPSPGKIQPRTLWEKVAGEARRMRGRSPLPPLLSQKARGVALKRRRPLSRPNVPGRLARSPRLNRCHRRSQDLGQAGPGRGRQHERLRPLCSRRKRRPELADHAHESVRLLLERRFVDGIDLRQRNNFRFLGNALAVSREFAADRAIVGGGVGACRVHKMDERAAALDMAKEPVAEAVALMRALDQAGYVGEHKVAAIDPDDAEARMEGSERIIGDFGLGGGDGGEEGRFAGVRQADEAGVRDQLEPKKQRALDASETGIGATRGAVGRGGEMEVAKTTVAALGDHHALARLSHVGEHRAAFLVEHLRPDRNLQHRVGASPAGAIAAHPVHSGLGLEMLLVAKVDERVEAVRAFDHDIAAAPAVAAIGAAELDEFLAAERDRARPAVARADVHARLVEKLHCLLPLTGRAPSRLPPRFAAGGWRLPNPRG